MNAVYRSLVRNRRIFKVAIIGLTAGYLLKSKSAIIGHFEGILTITKNHVLILFVRRKDARLYQKISTNNENFLFVLHKLFPQHYKDP